MYSSPCSLRSSCCAALIALAAVAGISRLEPVDAKSAGTLQVASAQACAAALSHSRAPFYSAAIQTLGAQFYGSRAKFAGERARDPGRSHPESFALAKPFPAFARTVGSPLVLPPIAPLAFSARPRSFPYAIGPPMRGVPSPLRVVGTEVPGDSSTRHSQPSPIARSFSSLRLVRTVRSDARLLP